MVCAVLLSSSTTVPFYLWHFFKYTIPHLIIFSLLDRRYSFLYYTPIEKYLLGSWSNRWSMTTMSNSYADWGSSFQICRPWTFIKCFNAWSTTSGRKAKSPFDHCLRLHVVCWVVDMQKKGNGVPAIGKRPIVSLGTQLTVVNMCLTEWIYLNTYRMNNGYHKLGTWVGQKEWWIFITKNVHGSSHSSGE